MQNSSVYLGFTAISDNEDGSKSLSAHDGLDYHKLNDGDVLVMEETLMEFDDEMNALMKKVKLRMIELGYAVSGEKPPGNRPSKSPQ